jgi:hypothetical protein
VLGAITAILLVNLGENTAILCGGSGFYTLILGIKIISTHLLK